MLTERHCQLCSSDALSQNYTRLHSDWLIDMCRMIFLLSFRCWSSLGMFGLIWPPPSSRNGGCTSKGVDQWWCIAEYVTRCDQTIYYCVYLFKMINCAFLPLLFIEVFPQLSVPFARSDRIFDSIRDLSGTFFGVVKTPASSAKGRLLF